MTVQPGDPTPWGTDALAERQAIIDLLHHYCSCVDRQEIDRLADEVYTEDAVDDHGFGVWRGREQIRRAFASFMPRYAATAHVIGNARVEFDGDQASSTAYVTAWHWLADSGHDEADFVMVGVYRDQLRRIADGWRISHRRFRRIGPAPAALGVLPDFLARTDQHAHPVPSEGRDRSGRANA